MGPRAVYCALLLGLSARPVICQTRPGQPRFSAHIGYGHLYGWLGTVGEARLFHGRVGLIAGVGVLPRELSNFPTTMAGTVGVRFYNYEASGYLSFVDVTSSLLQVRRGAAIVGAPIVHDYGPAFSFGFGYRARSGFTFTAGSGIGLTDHKSVALLDVGLGWTWRH